MSEINIEKNLDINGSIYINNYLYKMMPVGVIAYYSGIWVDNSTMPGWYKCDGANGTPNLVDRFIKGGSTSGTSGGSSSVTLSTANIPAHTHTATHGHTISFSNSGAHSHSLDTIDDDDHGSTYTLAKSKQLSYGYMFDVSDSHTHSLTIATNNLTTGSAGSTTAFTVDPPWYKLIFIMKVSNV